MQSKTFTIKLDKSIPEVDLFTSGISFTLKGEHDIHTGLDIIVANAVVNSPSYITSTPATISVNSITSYVLSIKVSNPTATNLEDLLLEYVPGDWLEYARESTSPMLNKYQPFNNFYDGSGNLFNDINYNSPFTTSHLNLSFDRIVDMELQFSYDSSVNVIFTDDVNPMRLINSRWILNESGLAAKLAERNQTKDTNTYSEEYFHRTELIPAYKNVASVTFNGVITAGKLPGGGYRYFFRYLTADGAETNIIEETRLIEVHRGDSIQTTVGEDGSDSTGNTVSITLSNLDSSYYAIRVYYSLSVGNTSSITSAFKIIEPYIIEDGKCKILHTGYEVIEAIDKNLLDVSYSLISQAKTLTTADNRLLSCNTELKNLYDRELAIRAASVNISEDKFDIIYSADITADGVNNYSNPNFSYDKTGYWRGETYELGVVFTSDSGLSPVYPIHGIDNLSGLAKYNPDLIGSAGPGFYKDGENSLGVYRTNKSLSNLWLYNDSSNELTFQGTKLKADISSLLGYSKHIVSTVIANDGGMYILYDKGLDKYYLDGVFNTHHFAGNVSQLYEAYTAPSSDVYLDFINIDGSNAQLKLQAGINRVEYITDVLKDTKPNGDVVYPVKLEGDYTGFFFVRRSRKPDKIAQGIVTPTMAIPIYTSYNADAATAITGEWSGIGVKSPVHGDSVTFVPAPNCLSPWGVENFIDGQVKFKEKYPEGGYVPVDPQPNPVMDFVQRSPVIDYEDSKSWAFYSPDIDSNPVFFATKFDNREYGISIHDARISTDYEYVDNPPLYTDHQPYVIKINNSYNTSGSEILKFKMEGAFTESGSSSPSSKSFSAKHDRNLAMFLNSPVNDIDHSIHFSYWAEAPAGNNIFKDDNFIYYPVTIGVPIDPIIDMAKFGPKNDSDVPENRTPSTGVNYGRYLGVKLPDYVGGLDGLNMTINYGNSTTTQSNHESSLKQAKNFIAPDNASSYGFMANLYENKRANELKRSEWEARYAGEEDTRYYAISQRYNIDTFIYSDSNLDIYGGDCFLGLQWKQVWSPLGIEGALVTDDFNAYRWNRRALGMLDYGMAMAVPAQCNYNFHLRTKDRTDKREHKVYGRDRSFLPIKKTIRGDRLLETGTYNFGYKDEGSEKDYFRLNINSPYIKVSYPNRIYASNPGIENEFWNGFTVFTGLNFRDYNSELGAITKIITVNNFTYVIFHHGIAQVGINERTMLSTDTGGVFTDSADVLAKRSNVLSNNYGAQHLHAIVASSGFLYGIDALNKKVWRTNQKGATLISDFKIQNLLTEIIDEKQEQTAAGGGVFDIYSSYDLIKGDIIFTFYVRSEDDTKEMYAKSLVFNEPTGIWICETDDTRKFMFKAGEERYSFPSLLKNPLELGTIYKYYRAGTNQRKSYYNKFYGDLYEAHIGFNVLDDLSTSKIFNNIYIIGNHSMPYQVQYGMEDVNDRKTQLLIPHTNVSYVIPDVTVTGLVDKDYFEISSTTSITKWNGEPLGFGDFITISNESNVPFYYICMGIEENKLYVDKLLGSNFITQPLVLGYKNPVRLSTSLYEDTFGKIIIKTAEDSSLSKLYTPRGKWVQVRLDYEGMSQAFVEKVLSTYTVSYS